MENSSKILKTPLRASLCTLLLGILSRFMSFPYASGIIFASFAAILILYTLRFAEKHEKKSIDFVKMILVLFWTTNGLLRLLEFEYTIVFQIGTALMFVTWFAMEGTAYFMDNQLKTKQNKTADLIWNILMIIGVLIIIFGGIMHLLSIESASTLLTIGLTIVTIYILKDIFSPETAKNKDNINKELNV